MATQRKFKEEFKEEFMAKNEFKAPRKLPNGQRGDVRKHCQTFKMSADDENDQMFLAHLYRTIWIYGGEITINDGTEQETYHFKKTS